MARLINPPKYPPTSGFFYAQKKQQGTLMHVDADTGWKGLGLAVATAIVLKTGSVAYDWFGEANEAHQKVNALDSVPEKFEHIENRLDLIHGDLNYLKGGVDQLSKSYDENTARYREFLEEAERRRAE